MQSKSTMRTPLGRVCGLGSAKAGTGHFWMQRLTATANAVLVVAFVSILLMITGKPYQAVMAILSHPVAALLLLLFIISALIHMRIGMQTIIEDYVHVEGAKILAVIANTFFAVAVGAACVFSLLKIAFGG
jgi:succinate dehydrogenase / fumarate reductase membrane anchor subunit